MPVLRRPAVGCSQGWPQYQALLPYVQTLRRRQVGMSDQRERLGKGWRFPVSLQLAGEVGLSAYEANVREAIFVILGTAPGERVGRPEFGCLIHELMFAPNNPATAALAQFYCESAIYKFEPRVGKVSVAAVPHPTEGNRLDIRVAYVLREETTSRNLVYPFYMQESAP